MYYSTTYKYAARSSFELCNIFPGKKRSLACLKMANLWQRLSEAPQHTSIGGLLPCVRWFKAFCSALCTKIYVVWIWSSAKWLKKFITKNASCLERNRHYKSIIIQTIKMLHFYLQIVALDRCFEMFKIE